MNLIIFISTTAITQSPIESYILQEMKDHYFPSVGIRYIQDGKITIAKRYGHAITQQDIPFTQHTRSIVATENWLLTNNTSVNMNQNEVRNPIPNFLDYEKVISRDIINIL